MGWLEERVGAVGLDEAIVERRAEAGMVTGVIAMTHAYHVALGWGIALTVLAGYALRTVRRGRSLAERVPPEQRRWS